MEASSYDPIGLESNTPALEPAYDAERLKADSAYRYKKIDKFTAYLNSIPDYADRVRYYLDMTVAMGFPIPDFYAGLKMSVFDGKPQFVSTLSLHIPVGKEIGANGFGPDWKPYKPWKPRNAYTRTDTDKGVPRDLTLTTSSKEWKLSYRNNEQRGTLCKLWFYMVRYSRFPRLIFNEQDEYREWINETKEERIARFNRNSIGRNRSVYVKTELGDIQHDMQQLLQDFKSVRDKRDKVLERYELGKVKNKKARKQQEYNQETEQDQPFDLIRRELSEKKGIKWSVFRQGSELECFGILWGMVEYWQWLESGAIEIISAQNNGTTDTKPNEITRPKKNTFNNMPLPDVEEYFMQLAEEKNKDGNPFLTNEQVKQFIARAFCGDMSIQPIALNMAKGECASVGKLFYLYYSRCTGDYAIESTKHCKEKYVRLLTNNFTNYKYNAVFANFNNYKNASKKWK